MKKINPQGFFVLCFVIVFVVISWLAFHWHAELDTLQKDGGASAAAVSQTENQTQVQAIVQKVGQLIVLPSGETPTVASVVNPSLLNSQPFFANAAKGDFVLIYTVAKEAILYDPNMNKIIAVAPISIGSASSTIRLPATSPN